MSAALCRCRLFHANESMEQRRVHWRIHQHAVPPTTGRRFAVSEDGAATPVVDPKATCKVGCERCGRVWTMKVKEAAGLPDAKAAAVSS